jgi:predicted DNA-binding transcriptional regulator YafY
MTLINITPETEGVITRRYRNYKGEVGVRTILPVDITLKHSEYHSEGNEKVWILEAYDLEKQAMRDFAFNDFLEDK